MATAAAMGAVTEGVVKELLEGAIVLGLPGTDYRLHLAADGATPTAPPAVAAPATHDPADPTPEGPASPGRPQVPGTPAAPGVPGVPVVGRRVRGRILARAKRVDVLRAGGRFIEPVFGRPRRVHGTVLAADDAANTLTVACAPGCAFTCELTMDQQASRFPPGTLVGFDVERGAKFVEES